MKNNATLLYNCCLIVGDSLAIIAAFTVAYVLRVSLNHRALSAPVHAMTYIAILVSLLPFWILIFGLIGLYNSRIHEQRFSELGRLVVGSFIGILFIISYSYVTNTTIFPARLVTFYSFALVFSFVLFFRTLARGIRRDLFSYGIGINNVLIIGDTPVTHELIDALADTAVTGYRVVGVIGGVKHPLRQDVQCPQFKSFTEAIEAFTDKQLHTIVQTELYSSAERNNEILTYAQENHIAYRFVPGNSELFVGNIEVGLFQSVPMIAVHQTALIGWGRVVKRLTDLILGGLLLILFSPIMLLVAAAIKLTGGGSVFFRQTRLTRYNREFRVYKFHSQNPRYDGTTPEEAFKLMGRPELVKTYRENGDFLPHDPRVTPLGRLLRRSSLDELPQLINVVKGDISLVGPRALIPQELALYARRHTILSVKSGVTGLAVISGRRDISFEERRKLDLFYVQNWSFWGDIVILTKTVWVVLFHRGAI
jgi:exopolysaccharide biosynthesis polyprenyl glycosylphosphotransferase